MDRIRPLDAIYIDTLFLGWRTLQIRTRLILMRSEIPRRNPVVDRCLHKSGAIASCCVLSWKAHPRAAAARRSSLRSARQRCGAGCILVAASHQTQVIPSVSTRHACASFLTNKRSSGATRRGGTPVYLQAGEALPALCLRASPNNALPVPRKAAVKLRDWRCGERTPSVLAASRFTGPGLASAAPLPAPMRKKFLRTSR